MEGVVLVLTPSEADALHEMFRLVQADERIREYMLGQPMFAGRLMSVLDKLELGVKKAGGHA